MNAQPSTNKKAPRKSETQSQTHSAIVPTEYTPRQLNIVENPVEIVEQGRAMARQLNDVIKQASLITRIGNSDHLQFEAWQTLGAFMGVTPKTEKVEVLEDKGKVFAARAHAVLLDRNGNVVGGAEALCSRAERNWKSKDWFQLESMAQTRAAAKALRMKFAWIVVLAGYNPTPAEEMVVEATARPAKATTYKATHHAPVVKKDMPASEIECPDCIRAGRMPVGKIRYVKEGKKRDGNTWTLYGCTNYDKKTCNFTSLDGLHGIQIASNAAKKAWEGMNMEHMPQEEVYPELANQDEPVELENIPV